MQTTFFCHFCECLFTPNDPAAARYRLNKNGQVFCSKTCASMKHAGYKEYPSEHSSWRSMKQRCKNPKNTHYVRYGGRGITYDQSWENFEVFLRDMGAKPTSNMELDRIDNDGNYCKENCRWATRKEQTRNRGGARATRLYTFNDKTMCIADWAKEIGITPQSLQKRLNNGWPLEIALNPEKRDGGDRSKWVASSVSSTKGKTVRNKNSKFITINDVTKTYSEWEKEKGLSKGLISKRIQQGCTEYEAVTKPMSATHQNIRKK
jgi:hypothetical protein